MTLQKIEPAAKLNPIPKVDIVKFGIGLLFLVGVMFYSDGYLAVSGAYFLAPAVIVGGFAAMNIGANDGSNAIGRSAASAGMAALLYFTIRGVMLP